MSMSMRMYLRLATPQDVHGFAAVKALGTPHGVFQGLRVNPKVESRFSTVCDPGLFALQHTQFGMDFSTT